MTFPDGETMPSHSRQCLLIVFISLLITLDFSAPEFGVGLRHSEIAAILMPMPETSIHKDACAIFTHDDVGMPRQPLMEESIPKAP